MFCFFFVFFSRKFHDVSASLFLKLYISIHKFCTGPVFFVESATRLPAILWWKQFRSQKHWVGGAIVSDSLLQYIAPIIYQHWWRLMLISYFLQGSIYRKTFSQPKIWPKIEVFCPKSQTCSGKTYSQPLSQQVTEPESSFCWWSFAARQTKTLLQDADWEN